MKPELIAEAWHEVAAHDDHLLADYLKLALSEIKRLSNEGVPGVVVKKVFDCQDMPKETRKIFLATWDNKGNDNYVEWDLYEMELDNPVVTAWLIANGAEKDEEVLVKYWW